MRRTITFVTFALASLLVSSQASAQEAPLPPLPPSATSPEAAPPVAPAVAPPPPPSPDVTIVAAPPPPPPPPPAALVLPCVDPPGAHVHDGFYFRLAQGAAYTSITGTGSSGATHISGAGTSSTILIGGTPARGLVIGGGIHVSDADGSLEGGPLNNSSVSGSTLTLGPFVDYFPDPRDGWHVGLLTGFGGTTVSAGSTSESNLAFAGTAFGGYDTWIGPQWSLGIMATVSAATPGELTDGNGNDTGYRATPFSFGIEATLLLH